MPNVVEQRDSLDQGVRASRKRARVKPGDPFVTAPQNRVDEMRLLEARIEGQREQPGPRGETTRAWRTAARRGISRRTSPCSSATNTRPSGANAMSVGLRNPSAIRSIRSRNPSEVLTVMPLDHVAAGLASPPGSGRFVHLQRRRTGAFERRAVDTMKTASSSVWMPAGIAEAGRRNRRRLTSGEEGG